MRRTRDVNGLDRNGGVPIGSTCTRRTKLKRRDVDGIDTFATAAPIMANTTRYICTQKTAKPMLKTKMAAVYKMSGGGSPKSTAGCVTLTLENGTFTAFKGKFGTLIWPSGTLMLPSLHSEILYYRTQFG